MNFEAFSKKQLKVLTWWCKNSSEGGYDGIICDGAVRSGEDVFKLIALGADACLIGRPYVVSVYGGGAHGAELYTRKILWELQNVMRQTDSRTLKDITRDKIVACRN